MKRKVDPSAGGDALGHRAGLIYRVLSLVSMAHIEYSALWQNIPDVPHKDLSVNGNRVLVRVFIESLGPNVCKPQADLTCPRETTTSQPVVVRLTQMRLFEGFPGDQEVLVNSSLSARTSNDGTMGIDDTNERIREGSKAIQLQRRRPRAL
ncbi:hypothetical protein L210DRAFT_3505485 [Boletus edulis BED1]|uniref:Uncharacterized protein n=1 Tax=Boletus edulis BED1 TaxID=1328754 RepID=A0AAD4GD11_BOLED|nr:hypothetical protein L210DRAFT_3505485 [Boletus edulis BED1]